MSGVYTQQIVWSAAIFASMTIYRSTILQIKGTNGKNDAKNVKLGILAGMLYTSASYFMLKSYEKIPASIGFTIIQLNAVWTILIGVFYFKEISFSQNRKRVLSGLLLALLGVALLSLARK